MLVGQPLAGRLCDVARCSAPGHHRGDGVRGLLRGRHGRGLVLAARRAAGVAGGVRVGVGPERAGDAPRGRPGPPARPGVRGAGLGARRRGRPRTGDRRARHRRVRVAGDLRRQPPGRAGGALRAAAPRRAVRRHVRARRERRARRPPVGCSTACSARPSPPRRCPPSRSTPSSWPCRSCSTAAGWSAASIGVALSFLTLGMVVMGPYGGRLGDAPRPAPARRPRPGRHPRRRGRVRARRRRRPVGGARPHPAAVRPRAGRGDPQRDDRGHRGRTAGARRVGGRAALGQPLRGQHRVHPRAGRRRARRRLRAGDAADRVRGQPGGVPGGGPPASGAGRHASRRPSGREQLPAGTPGAATAVDGRGAVVVLRATADLRRDRHEGRGRAARRRHDRLRAPSTRP